MERGWLRADRGFASGRWSSGFSGLRQFGRGTRSGFNYSRKAVTAFFSGLGALTLLIFVLAAVLNPTPENVGRAAEEGVSQQLPDDPVDVALKVILAGATLVGGFAVWLAYKHGKAR